MDRWLKAALDYIPDWIDFQMRVFQRPGCTVAMTHRGRVVFEGAWGFADVARKQLMTPRHRFRVASHSKSFTAAGIMKLREQRALRLDDPVGEHVDGLHKKIAEATIQQVLSHGAGITRDGGDPVFWLEAKRFPDAAALQRTLTPTIPAATRLKYSNHGYGLLGLVIEAVTGERYADWMQREVIAVAGLAETDPDMRPALRGKLAKGYSAKALLDRRVTIPAQMATNAIAPGVGFVSTAADLARFYAQLAPQAKRSLLSAASRREMVRRQWRDPYSSVESYYGLGLASGQVGDWTWVGHGGGFPGFVTRTAVLLDQEIAISVLTNCGDGLAGPWLDGIVQIMRGFNRNGAPTRRTSGWTGRWWGAYGPCDLVPMANKVIAANPFAFNPFLDCSELTPTGRDRARISQAGGFGNYGEEVVLKRGARDRIAEISFAGWPLQTEAKAAKALTDRYEKPAKKKRRRR